MIHTKPQSRFDAPPCAVTSYGILDLSHTSSRTGPALKALAAPKNRREKPLSLRHRRLLTSTWRLSYGCHIAWMVGRTARKSRAQINPVAVSDEKLMEQ